MAVEPTAMVVTGIPSKALVIATKLEKETPSTILLACVRIVTIGLPRVSLGLTS